MRPENNGGDSVRPLERDLAGAHGLAVEMDGAGATQARAAPELGAGQLEVLAHHPEQRGIGLSGDARRLAVDRECHSRHAFSPWLASRDFLFLFARIAALCSVGVARQRSLE